MILKMLVEFTVVGSDDDGEGQTLETICAALEAVGYHVEFKISDTQPDVAMITLIKKPTIQVA